MPAPIAEHALLSDCRTAALVTTGGAVDWWPAPRFDDASAFSALLDDEAGHFSVRPAAAPDEVTRRYLDGTLVLETTSVVGGAALRLTDALAFGPGPPTLVRVAEAVGGDVDVEVEFVPRPQLGLVVPELERAGGALVTVGGPQRVVLRGPAGRVTVRAGERVGWVVHCLDGMLAEPPAPADPFALLEATVAAWRAWSAAHEPFDGPHAGAVATAGLVLRGLSYAPSGAVIAAATTSLPERPGGPANFDYRFAWLRDAAWVVQALLVTGCTQEAQRWFAWIVRASLPGALDGAGPQVVFGAEGERELGEVELHHLAGHLGSRPVRLGNAAWRQRQLDVPGHVLDSAWSLREHLELDERTARFLCTLADRAARCWREPDSSIWEGREGERHYVVSKVMCWVALDRAVRLADRLGEGARPGAWAAEAERVREAVLREGWSEARGAYTGAFGSDHLDAGVLLMPLVGFLPMEDERMAATVAVVEAELGDGEGLLRRWTGAEDGAFVLASFWLAECLALGGDLERAEAVFARAAGAANDVGLLAEEVDMETGEPLGNVPQAIAHAGLACCAQALREAREGALA